MTSKIKTLFVFYILLTTSCVLISGSVFALEQVDSDKTSYLFHLYYDNGNLLADRDFEFKYDIVPEEYTPELISAPFPFKGEIINFKNEAVSSFIFDPRGGDLNFKSGKVKVKAPYIADGQKAVFYDFEGRQLMTIFVNESSFCNDDSICDDEKGEDEKSCPNDCRLSAPESEPEKTPNQNQGISGGMLSALIILIIGLVLSGGWYAWRKWYKSKHVNEGEFTNKL